MVTRLFLLALFVAGCATLPLAPPIPPRPAGLPFLTGLVAWTPMVPDDVAHLSMWPAPGPLLRVPVQTAAGATEALDQLTPFARVQLLVETVDDALAAALGPVAGRAYRVELGNELSFTQDAAYVSTFFQRSIRALRDGGYGGRICTGGIPNLETETLLWLRISLAGLPPDIEVCWHGYGDWISELAQLHAVIGGRMPCMSEWGSFAQTPATEQAIADRVAREATVLYDSGDGCGLYYQLHDGDGPANAFGVHAMDGHWRATEQALRAAVRIK